MPLLSQWTRSVDSHTSRYRLPRRWESSQEVPPPIDRSVAIRKNLSPSGERIRNGSRRPLVPNVELSTGCPPLSSAQRSALLPWLAAKWIFSPAIVSPVK